MTFLSDLPPHGPARERAVADAIATGRIDPPIWTEVRCGPVVLTVSSDYLQIAGARIPMSTANAQAAVDSLGALLPTPRIVVAIEDAAREVGRIVPFVPWPRWQDDSQLATETIAWRERNIPPGTGLLAGCLKDVVLAASMPAGRVVIFGGIYANGLRVQPVYSGHEAAFDGGYAHGVRAVLDACTMNGKPARVSDILTGPDAALLGGPVAALRYDTLATAPTDRPAAPDGRPTDPAPRVLRRGDRGDDVAELQRLLTAAGWYTRSDGVFGPLTEAAVRAFQYDTGLAQDGLAGVKTLAALRAHRPADAVPFVQARNFRTGRLRPVRAVVLHTAETSEAPDVAEKLAAWAAGPSAPMASWHYAVDADSIVQCVREEDTAFAAPGLNADGVQVEMSGRAAQDAAGWSDAYSRAVLARAAGLVADVCRRHALPVAFVDAAGLLRGERGITTHAEVTKAYRQSTHTDPGKDFDMDAFLAAVRAS